MPDERLETVRLEYATPTVAAQRRNLVWALGGLIAGAFMLLLVTVEPFERPKSFVSIRVDCARRFRQIGQAMILYTGENRRMYPERFEQLLLTQNIASDSFLCPATDDQEATGPDIDAVLDAFTAGGHLSYIYLGRGLDEKASPETVLACEWLSNHDGEGINVLLGDGQVRWLPATEARAVLDQMAAGAHPVKLPPNSSTGVP